MADRAEVDLSTAVVDYYGVVDDLEGHPVHMKGFVGFGIAGVVVEDHIAEEAGCKPVGRSWGDNSGRTAEQVVVYAASEAVVERDVVGHVVHSAIEELHSYQRHLEVLALGDLYKDRNSAGHCTLVEGLGLEVGEVHCSHFGV